MTSPALNDLKVIPDPQISGIRTLPAFEVEHKEKLAIPGDWLAMCTLWSDIFSTDYIGYWARGVAQDNNLGWLVWEFEEDDRFKPKPGLQMFGRSFDNEDKLHKEAIQAWKAGKPLPPHYHALNREAAVKAYLAMVTLPREKGKGGLDWYENSDATSYDVAVQLALLGELKYG
jgi:hypothetical protein